jgi:hypothetical protein
MMHLISSNHFVFVRQHSQVTPLSSIDGFHPSGKSSSLEFMADEVQIINAMRFRNRIKDHQ